jgi:hypothetical protein
VIAGNDSTVNEEMGSTGGISNGGSMAVVDSTIAGNRGPVDGGINNHGSLTLTNSTVSGNSSSGDAGGIRNTGALTLTNSTISGNRANGAGGGLLSALPAARASLLNVTIARNTADADGDSTGQGGGVAVLGGTVALTNTVLAGNLTGAAQPSDCAGALASHGHNAIGNSAGCALTGSSTGNLVGVSIALGPLRDNGGRTFTHALPAGSPLIDGGAAASPAVDQRGAPRPFDGNRDGKAACDIGAYEAAPLPRVRLPIAVK